MVTVVTVLYGCVIRTICYFCIARGKRGVIGQLVLSVKVALVNCNVW